MQVKNVYLSKAFKEFCSDNSPFYKLTVKTMGASIMKMLDIVNSSTINSCADFGAGSCETLFEIFKARNSGIELVAIDKDWNDFHCQGFSKEYQADKSFFNSVVRLPQLHL